MKILRKVLIGLIFLVLIFLILITIYKFFLRDKKDEKKKEIVIEEEKVNISEEEKENINKRLDSDFKYPFLESISYNIDNYKGKGNIFNDDKVKFIYLKEYMYSQYLTSEIAFDKNNTSVYKKCLKDVGSISIKEDNFIMLYKNLFNQDFKKKETDYAQFIDGYICATMPIGREENSPIIKVVNKIEDNGTTILKMVQLSNTASTLNNYEKYSDPSVITWPKDIEYSNIELKYKTVETGAYQIISLIVK